MKRVEVCGTVAGMACAVMLVGCSSDVEGAATAPLATVDTDPPSIVSTTIPTPVVTSTAAPTPTSTTAKTTTTAPPATADAARFESAPGFFYFTSPTGKFECAVFVTASSVAGCHGEFPSTAPRVEGSGAQGSAVPPNTIELTAGSPAKFSSSGDPRFHRFDGTALALPYDEILAIPGSGSSNGLSCRVEEKTGVTCNDQVGHGFTISDSAFELK